MNKTKLLILLILLSSVFYMAYVYKNKSDEKALVKCIDNILTTLNMDNIEVDVSNRIHSPIISGQISTKQKKQLIQFMKSKCMLQSFEDLIVEYNEYDIKISKINFKLDGFNGIATITGMVNSAFEQQEILSSFTAAVNKYYGPWVIEHEILISKEVSQSEFAIDISLIFSAISLVRTTDITLIENQLIVKGLVRNKSNLEQTVLQLNQIFQDELEIIYQLTPVIKDKDEIDDVEIDDFEIDIKPIKLPKFKLSS